MKFVYIMAKGIELPSARPEYVTDAIDRVYAQVSGNSESGWRLNGEESYRLAGVDEHRLIKHMIDTSDRAQKDFYFMDVGAGRFQWLGALAKFLDKNYAHTDKHFHIIGCSGEGAKLETVQYGIPSKMNLETTKTSKSTIYEFNGFKLEDAAKEFQHAGLFDRLNNNVDLIITNFALRHLVDPLGTFVQIYNLLKPKDGFMIMDGFPFYRVDESGKMIYSGGLNMDHLLLDIGAKFLKKPFDGMRSLDHYLIKKEQQQLTLPLYYKGSDYHPGATNSSEYTLYFMDPSHKKVMFLGDFSGYSGDREMYNFIKEKIGISTFFGKEYEAPIIFNIKSELMAYLEPHFSKSESFSDISQIILDYLVASKYLVKDTDIVSPKVGSYLTKNFTDADKYLQDLRQEDRDLSVSLRPFKQSRHRESEVEKLASLIWKYFDGYDEDEGEVISYDEDEEADIRDFIGRQFMPQNLQEGLLREEVLTELISKERDSIYSIVDIITGYAYIGISDDFTTIDTLDKALRFEEIEVTGVSLVTEGIS